MEHYEVFQGSLEVPLVKNDDHLCLLCEKFIFEAQLNHERLRCPNFGRCRRVPERFFPRCATHIQKTSFPREC